MTPEWCLITQKDACSHATQRSLSFRISYAPQNSFQFLLKVAGTRLNPQVNVILSCVHSSLTLVDFLILCAASSSAWRFPWNWKKLCWSCCGSMGRESSRQKVGGGGLWLERALAADNLAPLALSCLPLIPLSLLFCLPLAESTQLQPSIHYAWLNFIALCFFRVTHLASL